MYNTDNQSLHTPDNSPESVARARYSEPLASLSIIDAAIDNMDRKKQTPYRDAIQRIAETAFGSHDPTVEVPSVQSEPAVPDLMAAARAAIEQEFSDV